MPGGRVTNVDAPFWKAMREAERQIIEFYLDEADGHIGNAAILMGMDKAWTYRRLKKLGISKGTPKTKTKAPKDSNTTEPLHLRLVDEPDPVPDAEPAKAPNAQENDESIDDAEGEAPAPDAG